MSKRQWWIRLTLVLLVLGMQTAPGATAQDGRARPRHCVCYDVARGFYWCPCASERLARNAPWWVWRRQF